MALIEKWNTSETRDKCTIATCYNVAVQGTPYCPQHGGVGVKNRQDKKELANYNLNKWFAENNINEKLKDLSMVKNLVSEIVLLRQTLEFLLKQCKNPIEVIAQEMRIRDLVSTIRDTVESMHRLDKDLSNSLNQEQIEQLANVILEVLRNEGIEEEILEKIISRFNEVINTQEHTQNMMREQINNTIPGGIPEPEQII